MRLELSDYCVLEGAKIGTIRVIRFIRVIRIVVALDLGEPCS